MAENTRYKVLEEQIKKSDCRMQELATELRRHVDEGVNSAESALDAKLGRLESKMESRLEAYTVSMKSKLANIIKLLTREKQIAGNGEGSVDRTPLLPTPGTNPKLMQWDEQPGNPFLDRFNKPHLPKLPRIELPMFSGANPREWIRKCTKFFTIYQIAEQWRMEVIELYLEDKAEIWYQSLKMVKGRLSWSLKIIPNAYAYK